MNWNFTAQNSLAEYITEAEKNGPKGGGASQKVNFAERMKLLRETLSDISRNIFAKVWETRRSSRAFWQLWNT